MDLTCNWEWASSAEATFNNFVVMRVLADIVDTKELPNFRLINKVCNFVSTGSFRYRTPHIKFSEDNQITSFIETMKTRNPLLPLPYGKFNPYLVNISIPTIHQFVDNFSNEVIEYEFNHCANLIELRSLPLIPIIPQATIDVSIRQDFSQKIAIFLSGSEKTLEKVVFKNKTNVDIFSEELLNFPTVFSRLRFIESLDIKGLNSGGSIEIATLLAQRAPILETMEAQLSSFVRILPTNLFTSHRYLFPRMYIHSKWSSSGTTQAIQYLIKGGYKNIVHFSFFINNTHFLWDEEVLLILFRQLSNFIQIQKECLKSLEIRIEDTFGRLSHEECRIQLPVLVRLKEFTLMYMKNPENPYILSLAIDTFPNLQKLTLEDFIKNNENIFPSNIVMPSVRTLSINKYAVTQNTLHLMLPNLSHLEFRVMPSMIMLEYILTHLTQIKSLNLGDLPILEVLINPTNFWNQYTGQAARLCKKDFAKLCDGKLNVENEEVGRNENGFYEFGSLANLKELTELRVTISSQLELETLVYMSRPGKMKSLKKLSIVHAKLPERPIQYYKGIRKYFGINFASKGKYLKILKAYHKEVDYTSIVSERIVNRRLVRELTNFH